MVRVGIIGASGYTGAELLRLLARAPATSSVVVATGDSKPGRSAADLYPSLAAAYPELVVRRVRRRPCRRRRTRRRVPRAAARGVDGARAAARRHRCGCVVDLSAAFRLKDASLYPTWYGFEHDQPELLAEAVYGLPERTRDRAARGPPRRHARLLRHGRHAGARPARRCRADRARRGIIVDAASGVTGAGRVLDARRRCSAPSTRTSRPTGCSTIATRRRSSRTSAPGARRSCSRRTSRR